MASLKAVLRIESEKAPLCLETDKPLFSWYLDAPKRGCRQRAHRLTVTGADGTGGTPRKSANTSPLHSLHSTRKLTVTPPLPRASSSSSRVTPPIFANRVKLQVFSP